MTSERSKRRDFLSLIFISKLISKKLLITSMMTDRIGRHEVLLPINHNFNKICDIIGYFLNQNTIKTQNFVLLAVKKKAI